MLNQSDKDKLINMVKFPGYGTRLNSAVYGSKDMAGYYAAKKAAEQASTIEEAVEIVIDLLEAEKAEATNKTAKDFDSRRELNNYLRQHGYTWRKEDIDDGAGAYGEMGWEWVLRDEGGVAVDVDQALDEIKRGKDVVRGEIEATAKAEIERREAKEATTAAWIEAKEEVTSTMIEVEAFDDSEFVVEFDANETGSVRKIFRGKINDVECAVVERYIYEIIDSKQYYCADPDAAGLTPVQRNSNTNQ